MLFILDMKHSPEMCPMNNDTIRKKFKEQYSKMEEIAANLEIKILLNIGVAIEHNIIIVLDAPSIQAAESFIMEMELFSFNTITMRHAQYSDNVMKMLK